MQQDKNKLKLTRFEPKRDQLIRILLLTFVALLAGLAYWYGGNRGGLQEEQARQKSVSLQAEVLREQNSELRQRLALVESARKMDLEAVNNVRLLVRQLEDEKEELLKELSFFRSIMAPEDVATGVRVASFSLLEGRAPGSYRLRLVLSQVQRSNPFLKGTVSVFLLGEKEGKAQTFELSQLVEAGQSVATLGFRYFQTLPGDREYFDFTLPNGFQPAEIRVQVRITSGVRQSIESVYQWHQELAKDVRQSEVSE